VLHLPVARDDGVEGLAAELVDDGLAPRLVLLLHLALHDLSVDDDGPEATLGVRIRVGLEARHGQPHVRQQRRPLDKVVAQLLHHSVDVHRPKRLVRDPLVGDGLRTADEVLDLVEGLSQLLHGELAQQRPVGLLLCQRAAHT
jgi:hypothetical protein